MATDTEERRTTRTLKVVEQHARLRESLLLKLLLALLGLWGGFKHWDNPALVSGQAARSASLVDASLAKSRRMARSYATAMLQADDAVPKKMPATKDLYPRSGVNMLDVYSRPAEVYLYAISQGKTDAEALKMALARVESLARMDTALAERDETHDVWQAAKRTVIGHRRIIHPERSKSGSCGLCVVAATNFYSTGDLMPLHNRCECTDAPVYKDSDPGLRLNEHDLKEIYAGAGSNTMEDLKKIRVVVKENGEIGPVLVRQGQHFRDVKEVNRTGSREKFEPYSRPTPAQERAKWTAMRESSERSLKKLNEARAAGERSVDLSGTGTKYVVKDWTKAIQYHKSLIDRMTAKLR